jgi:nonsense-mediated mRNA decay protein 3
LYDAPALLDVEQCQKCRKARLSGEWRPFSNEEIKKWLSLKIKTPFKVKSAGVRLQESLSEEGKRNYDAYLDVEFNAEGITVKRIIPVRLRISQTQCRECSLRSGGYFEAVIQLRGDRDKIEKLANRLSHRIEREEGFVSKTEEKKEGLDLYISNKQAAHKAINWMKLSFNSSRTLAGMREGKELYRTTYCIRLEPKAPQAGDADGETEE